ncbi:hypothetical protein C2G38_2091333 [Gigaspora rosea]|uniref:Uncharacterized protein n=1 Tax=Gigaspora rosea TaxID=44941 RepID=A0A397VAI6_9GLOM|nr:hypothetical protein C2G38_2091333 [Gigaspora rosea]
MIVMIVMVVIIVMCQEIIHIEVDVPRIEATVLVVEVVEDLLETILQDIKIIILLIIEEVIVPLNIEEVTVLMNIKETTIYSIIK